VLRYIGELSGDLQHDKGIEVKLVSVPSILLWWLKVLILSSKYTQNLMVIDLLLYKELEHLSYARGVLEIYYFLIKGKKVASVSMFCIKSVQEIIKIY
jgi:hypothetical protein